MPLARDIYSLFHESVSTRKDFYTIPFSMFVLGVKNPPTKTQQEFTSTRIFLIHTQKMLFVHPFFPMKCAWCIFFFQAKKIEQHDLKRKSRQEEKALKEKKERIAKAQKAREEAAKKAEEEMAAGNIFLILCGSLFRNRTVNWLFRACHNA